MEKPISGVVRAEFEFNRPARVHCDSVLPLNLSTFPCQYPEGMPVQVHRVMHRGIVAHPNPDHLSPFNCICRRGTGRRRLTPHGLRRKWGLQNRERDSEKQRRDNILYGRYRRPPPSEGGTATREKESDESPGTRRYIALSFFLNSAISRA